jgi:hypothetical protein
VRAVEILEQRLPLPHRALIVPIPDGQGDPFANRRSKDRASRKDLTFLLATLPALREAMVGNRQSCQFRVITCWSTGPGLM